MKCVCVLFCLTALFLHSSVHGLKINGENVQKPTANVMNPVYRERKIENDSTILKDGNNISSLLNIKEYSAIEEFHVNEESVEKIHGNFRVVRGAEKTNTTENKVINTQLHKNETEEKEKKILEVIATNKPENKGTEEKKESQETATTKPKPNNSSTEEEFNRIMAGDFDILLEAKRFATFLNSPKMGEMVAKVYGPDNGKPPPLVSTAEGIVRGKRINKYGQTYDSFEGIPYASVPERFQAPKPPKPWTGIKNTTFEVDPCAQYTTFLGGFYGTEDCLYLNVHTPSIESTGLPVMVIVHGGGFNLLMGTRLFFGPERFIEKNIIVVLINYRLGALGFLSTRTADAPGNAGMKDIIAALTWIQKNIHMFGGDASQVTLFGSSSGATAVEYLTLSKMSKGLFSKFIMQSGSALNYLFHDSDPIKYALRLGSYLDYHTNDVKKLVDHLKETNVEELVEAAQRLGVDLLPLGISRPFSPSIEVPVPDEEMFLHDLPENILRSGDFVKLPSMMGFTTMEGSEFIKGLLVDPEFLNTIDEAFAYLLPPDLVNAMDRPQNIKALVNKVRQFYFNGERISNSTAKGYLDLIGDSILLYGLFESINIRMQQSGGPIYFWQMAYDGFLGLFRKYTSIGVPGVPHADELGYMFRVSLFDGYPTTNETEEVARRLVELVSNFLKYGNPTPAKTAILPVTWKPLEPNKPMDYLEITEKMVMKQDPFPYNERMAFWKHLYANKNNLV